MGTRVGVEGKIIKYVLPAVVLFLYIKLGLKEVVEHSVLKNAQGYGGLKISVGKKGAIGKAVSILM